MGRKNWRNIIRPLIFNRDRGFCLYCQKPISLSEGTLDHIIALTNGGDKSNPENIVWCCESCNWSKGSQDVWDWYKEKYGENTSLAYRLSRLAS